MTSKFHIFQLIGIPILLISFSPVTGSSREVPGSARMEVITADGKKFDAAFQEFRPADETMLFLMAAGGFETIPCAKLTTETLGRSAMRMKIVADWMPASSAEMCKAVIIAKSAAEEKSALSRIYRAGAVSSSIKEKLAWFQFYGILFQLLDSEIAADKAVLKLAAAEKLAAGVMAGAQQWVKDPKNRNNPLDPNDDRGVRHMAWANRRVKEIIHDPQKTALESKRKFMVGLASTQAYAVHCSYRNKTILGESILKIRAKVLARSFVGQEMQEAAGAIFNWLVARCLIHNYEGEEEALLLRGFGKVLDAQVDRSFEMLYFDLPDEQRALVIVAVKGALIRLTEGRITPQQMASGGTHDVLLKFLAAHSPEINSAKEVVDRIMPFLGESLRMASK